MEQPKFKIGDKVALANRGAPFTIGVMEYLSDIKMFSYGETRHTHSFLETRLTIYQEPVKKKLYAWSNHYEEIRFTVDNKIRTYGEAKDWRRASEYDIEYPP